MQKTTTLDVNIAQIPLKQFHYAQILKIEVQSKALTLTATRIMVP